MSHLRRVQCGVCRLYFMTAQPAQKYCSPKCSEVAMKKHKAEYEKKHPRPPHLYRKKKYSVTKDQFELDLKP